MNLRILKDSYKDFVAFLQLLLTQEQVQENTKTSTALTESLAQNDLPQTPSKPTKKVAQKSPISHTTQAMQSVLSDEKPKRKTPARTSVKTRAKTSSRRAQIIDFIAASGPVSIVDVTAKIKNYSTKTIQRELLALVKDGVLEKKGERRWSTYAIAQQTPGEM